MLFAKNIEHPVVKGFIQLVLPAGSIALLAWMWNTLFLRYVSNCDFKLDVFRPAFRQAIPPIYGLSTSIDWSYFVSLCVLMFGTLYLYSLLKNRTTQTLGIVFFFLFFLFSFAKTENRFSYSIAHYATYLESVGTFNSPADVIVRYTEKQSTLNVHSAHYPPGNLWLIKCFDEYASIALLKYCLYGLMALSLLVLFSLVEQLNPIVVFAIPALLIYPSLDVVAIPFFFFSIGLFVLLKVDSPLWKSMLLGIVSSLWLFFSFSVFVFWLFLLVLECVELFKTRIIKKEIIYYCLHVATVVLFFGALYLIFHYSILDNFKLALAHNVQINSNYFDDPIRFLFRSTGNVLEFCLGMGLPILLLFRRNNILQPNLLQLKKAFLFTLIIASCCGLFFMETDRVWFFLIPILLLIGNTEFQNNSIQYRRWFYFFAVVYTVWFELAAVHYC